MSSTNEIQLQVGTKIIEEFVVTDKQLAISFGSGDVPVFGTPGLVAMIEAAACKAIAPFLKSEETSVGTNVSIAHLSPTPEGGKIKVEVTVTQIEGRKIKFEAIAFDEKEKIGEGSHERFILNKDRFLKKAQEKLPK